MYVMSLEAYCYQARAQCVWERLSVSHVHEQQLGISSITCSASGGAPAGCAGRSCTHDLSVMAALSSRRLASLLFPVSQSDQERHFPQQGCTVFSRFSTHLLTSHRAPIKMERKSVTVTAWKLGVCGPELTTAHLCS